MAKILLVEDNEASADMLSRRLTRKGHQVTVAADGEAALELALEPGLQLILMDMSLPVMDGWEVTRRLKAEPLTRGILVVALTAHALPGQRERALEAGCDDYDTKPVELPRLLAKIDALVGGNP
jgi:two-component system cell cycle response regulator DivK